MFRIELFFFSSLALFVTLYVVISYLFGPDTGSFLGNLNQPSGSLVQNFLAASWRQQFSNILFLFLFFFIAYQSPQLFRPKILLLGSSVFFIDAWYRYDFYHISTYKMLVLWLFVVLVFVQKELFGSKPVRKNSFLVWFLLFLTVISATPAALYFQFSTTYNYVYELAAIFPLCVYSMYVYASTEQEEDIKSLVDWFAFIMVVVSVIAFYERYANPGAIEERVKSTFGNVTYFSTYIITLLPLFFAFLFKIDDLGSAGKKRWKLKINFDNWLCFFAFFLGLLSLYFTLSRASYLGFLVSAVLGLGLFAYAFYQEKFFKYLLLGLAGLVVVVAVLVTTFVVFDVAGAQRLLSVFSGEGYFPRFVGWTPALKASAESPIFGYGLGSSYNNFFSFFWQKAMLFHYEMSYNHSHNELFEVFEEGGLVGFLGTFAVIGYVLYLLLKVTLKKEVASQQKLISIAVIAGIVACYVDGLFSISIRQMAGRLPLYFLLGLGFSLAASHLALFQSWKKFLKGSYTFFTTSAWLRRSVILVLGVVVAYLFGLWSIAQYKFIDAMRLPEISRIDQMKQALSYHKDIYLLDELTSALIRQGNPDEVIAYGNLATEQIPYFRLIEAKLGWAYTAKKDTEQAFEHFGKMRSKNPYVPHVNTSYMYSALLLDKKDAFYDALRDGITYLLVKKNDILFGENFPLQSINQWFIYPVNFQGSSIEEVDDLATPYDVQIENDRIKILVRKDFYANLRKEALANAEAPQNRFLATALSAAEQFRASSSFVKDLKDPTKFNSFSAENKDKLTLNLLSWLVHAGLSF